MMILSLIPIGSIFAASFFVDNMGWKFLLMISAFISGVSLMIFFVIPEEGQISMLYLYLIFGIYSLFMRVLRSVTYLYTPEVYTTSVWSTALGMMNVFDKIATIVQPMVMASIVFTSFRWSMEIFGASYLISFLFSVLLTKETANKPMQDSFTMDDEEGEDWT